MRGISSKHEMGVQGLEIKMFSGKPLAKLSDFMDLLDQFEKNEIILYYKVE